MARYLVEQTFADGLRFTVDQEGARACLQIISNNELFGVTWLHSYVTPDRRKAFYVCEAPSPEAIRQAAQRNGLPVDRITEVRTPDPHFLL